MKPKLWQVILGTSGFMFAATAQADLTPSDYDVFATLTGSGAESGETLTADLGIVINADGTATVTLQNTSPLADPYPADDGGGVGDAPRIEELFWNQLNSAGLTATINSITDDTTTYDCDGVDATAGQCDWDLAGGGSSGGGGTFSLSYACGTSGQDSCNLGVPETLVFTLDADVDITAGDFLDAPSSTGGSGGWQICAHFQTVGSDGEDSGVGCGTTGGGDDLPEPGTLALLSLGLIGLGLVRRRREIS